MMLPLIAAALAAMNPTQSVQQENQVTVDLSASPYSEATRSAEDRMMEVIYTDLDARSVSYAQLNDGTIQQITADLKRSHQVQIDSFADAFARDEIAAGGSDAEARQRAAAYVDAYFEDLWDVQRDLASEAPR